MLIDIIDIHSHLQFKAFDDDRDEVIKRTLEDGVGVINVGTQADTSKAAVLLAEKYDQGIWATVGLHPIHTGKSFHDEQELGLGSFYSRGEVFDYDFYKNLAQNKSVVAIGECGLDYYHLTEETKEKQKNTFEEQVKLSLEVEKALMLHVRNGNTDKNAYLDVLEILKKYPKARGNVHFFAGDFDIAKKFLEIGFTISFTAVLTITNQYDEVVKNIPKGMFMIETDAPYVAPKIFRGKRNEPTYARETAKRIALIRGESYEEVARQTKETASRVFGLGLH